MSSAATKLADTALNPTHTPGHWHSDGQSAGCAAEFTAEQGELARLHAPRQPGRHWATLFASLSSPARPGSPPGAERSQ